tara:strand:+ start:68 stop:565 length:498 start_codon:yes stop_codon:yes gene_type:complete
MSWTIFKAECFNELSGGTQDSSQFSKKIFNEYHNSVVRHTDVLSGGSIANTTPQPIITILDIWLQLNSMSPPGTFADVNFLDQLKFVIPIYWLGAMATGPLGVTNVLFPGIWLPVELKANNNNMIMLNKISQLSILHMQTLFGTFTSSATGLIVPWSGGGLIAAG